MMLLGDYCLILFHICPASVEGTHHSKFRPLVFKLIHGSDIVHLSFSVCKVTRRSRETGGGGRDVCLAGGF